MRLLPSKRAHLYVLERSRIIVRDGRVEYISDDDRDVRGFNIPVANTSYLLIGPGSSITNEAVRILSGEGVCIGFCGTGGTPLHAAQDAFPNMVLPADEYREPKFLQQWIEIWRCPEKRLKAAKLLFRTRLEHLGELWIHLDFNLQMPAPPTPREIKSINKMVDDAQDVSTLLGIEGDLVKKLYKIMAETYGFKEFKRIHGHKQTKMPNEDVVLDPNSLLDHGNYLAYGLASATLWALGIPASLAVCHGKTRRGGLVFDLADVIKDAIVLPTAFTFAARVRKESSLTRTDFRSELIGLFDDAKALDCLFNIMIRAIEEC